MSGLAQTYARMGRTDEAKRLLKQVISRQSESHQRSACVGRTLYAHRRHAAGNQPFAARRSPAAEPARRVDAWRGLSEAEAAGQGQADARPRARSTAPGNVEIFQAAANYYREEHDYKAAIPLLKSAPKMTPAVLADLGYTLRARRRQRRSREVLRQGRQRRRPKKSATSSVQPKPQLRVGDLEKTQEYLSRAASHRCQSLSPARHPRSAGQRREPPGRCDHRIQSRHQGAAAGGVPEGQLYPIQLRLNLAELYRENGDDAAAHQQLATAEAEINKLAMWKVRPRPSSCAFAPRSRLPTTI